MKTVRPIEYARMERRIIIFCLCVIIASPLSSQILMSAGDYVQDFNSLSNSGGPFSWTNNLTLPGWYAATNLTGPKSGAVASYSASAGATTSGGFYSLGDSGSTERALGSLASSGPGNFAYGVRFYNDTPSAQTNFTINYTGEQWRVAATNLQNLTFSYQVGSSLTNADAQGVQTWTAFPALDFISPNTNLNGSAHALVGNDPTNRVVFTNILLTGVVVPAGQELFLRWYDADDTNSDNILAIDDFTISFQTTTNVSIPVVPVVSTNSTVLLMTYNVKGNGTTDWSTNTVQAQALGREIGYLNPDIITFNEIPYTNTWQMTNWVTAFMPGFYLATNSGTDGFIRSVIASRFPINYSHKWLDGADLNPFGYTNSNFTRDLFEAEINVPNWPLPLHVFVTHLKSSNTGYTDAAAKRAAEAACITNFFATNFFVLYPNHPFTLSGDMNESDTNAIAIQRLISPAMTTRLTSPVNSISGSINTYSSASPSERIDYIFPCALLATNFSGDQVFRSDVLTPTPTNLLKSDSTNASDHLPVIITLNNPFNTSFRLLSCVRSNQSVTLQWETATNRFFNIQTSSNLVDWSLLGSNLFATGTNLTFSAGNAPNPAQYFRVYRVP